MPCDSSHMLSDNFEKELSKVACLIDETNGDDWDDRSWNGYHSKVYCKGLHKTTTADDMVERLCSHLKVYGASSYSLEMQIWWRDHQKSDKEKGE